MRRRFFIASAALLALSAIGLAQQPVTKPASPYGVVTPGAVDAFRRFALVQESARRVFDSAVAEASLDGARLLSPEGGPRFVLIKKN